MAFYRLFLIPLFLLICNCTFAATFVVTSNADSGPNTLRQALLDAAVNGTATIDLITFNLPGNTQAAITIMVQTQLPDVTGNVIIDGTTQPGAVLGVSNAKVIITVATPAQNLNAFNVSAQIGANDAVEFYGLYITGFSPQAQGFGSAIITNANCKLVIGAPGKGNVICGNQNVVISFLKNAKIQSNFLGVEPDGETGAPNAAILGSGDQYDNLLVGGDDPAMGNVIVAGFRDGINLGGTSGNVNATVTFKNNYFGTDYKATKTIDVAFNAFITVNAYQTNVILTGNVFSASDEAISALNQTTVIIKGNYFGTDKTQTYKLGTSGQAISANSHVTMIIGGNAPADQNVITGYFNPILSINFSTVNIIKNSFYCNNIVLLDDESNDDHVKIINLTDNSVSGDSPPGAIVQLYYTGNQCGNCNPTTWFATVTANGSGKWSYSGNTKQNIMASSTIGGNTYGFQPYNVAQNEVNIVNFDCHHKGSIELAEKRSGRFQFTWKNSAGTPVSFTQKADNLDPGDYTLEINEVGSCPTATGTFTVLDITPKAYGGNFPLNCTYPTAYFTEYPSVGPGLTVAKYFWTDKDGNALPGGDKANITGLAAGTYYLYITDSNGCNSNTATFTVTPAPDMPVINYTNVQPQDATCDQPNGSIMGIDMSNSNGATYGWSKVDGSQTYPNVKDLTGAPAGDYYFYVNYNFNCPPIKSKTFTLASVGSITLDVSGEAPVPSTCSNSNGGIKGILAPGATIYKWYSNGTNQEVGSTLDLSGVPAGDYYLVASNSTCSQKTLVYTIPNIPPNITYPSNLAETDASCGLGNGSISIVFGSGPPKSYRWAKIDGTSLVADQPLTGVPSGVYQLYVTDDNGCESKYQTYTVKDALPLSIVFGSEQVTNDKCGLTIGSIKNIHIAGGIPPYTYAWSTDPKLPPFSTDVDITSLSKGNYYLTVKDASSCDIALKSYFLDNLSEDVPTPTADNLQVCSGAQVTIAVNNPQSGYSYRLYDNATSITALDDQSSGVFKVSAPASRSYFISQYTGSCESSRTEVNITIGLSAINVPNAFTPNGDGINDYWGIKGLENNTNGLVQVFTRYGTKVFESRGYSQPFDGNINGTKLPVGVYYYIINLSSTCGLLSGNLTILR